MPNSIKENKKNTRKTWKQDPETVKKNILKIATKEISKNGFAGSRINIIAQKCDTSKRMIYYYFKNKEGLYKAVLEETYDSIRKAEEKMHLDNLEPIEALEKLVEFTVKHHASNPDFIKLIMIENSHDCKYLKQSSIIKEVNAPAIKRVEEIYNKGLKKGFFREGITALEIHWHISALSFFNISNRPSFTTAFGDILTSKENNSLFEKHIQQMVLRFVLKEEMFGKIS